MWQSIIPPLHEELQEHNIDVWCEWCAHMKTDIHSVFVCACFWWQSSKCHSPYWFSLFLVTAWASRTSETRPLSSVIHDQHLHTCSHTLKCDDVIWMVWYLSIYVNVSNDVSSTHLCVFPVVSGGILYVCERVSCMLSPSVILFSHAVVLFWRLATAVCGRSVSSPPG